MPSWDPTKYSSATENRSDIINYFVELFENRIRKSIPTAQQKKWLMEDYYPHLCAHHSMLFGYLEEIDKIYGHFQSESGYNVILEFYSKAKLFDQYLRDLEAILFLPPKRHPNDKISEYMLSTFHDRFYL